MRARIVIFSFIAASLPLLFVAGACGEGRSGLPRAGSGAEFPIIEGFGVKSQLFTKADFPVTLAFAPDGRLFYNELETGNTRIITPEGEVLEEPFFHVDVFRGAEGGLLGLAIDPEFASNHYVYILFTAPVEERATSSKLQIIRLTDVDNVGTDPTIIGDLPEAFPGTTIHVGGNIHFGPDGFLYVTIGDGSKVELAQDLSSPWGKILRINKADGSAAPDNPFVDQPGADPRIFAYGFRNSFDFTFHPDTGQLYATENGDGACDELNLVVEGGNYGWPQSEERTVELCKNPGAIEAIHYFSIYPAIHSGRQVSNNAPTGIEFLTSKLYEPLLLDRSLLTCGANPGTMLHFSLDGVNRDVAGDGSIVDRFCRLDIAMGPDGMVYYSNTEEIRRLVPE